MSLDFNKHLRLQETIIKLRDMPNLSLDNINKIYLLEILNEKLRCGEKLDNTDQSVYDKFFKGEFISSDFMGEENKTVNEFLPEFKGEFGEQGIPPLVCGICGNNKFRVNASDSVLIFHCMEDEWKATIFSMTALAADNKLFSTSTNVHIPLKLQLATMTELLNSKKVFESLLGDIEINL